MKKGLYDSFAARWYHGGTVWFYSDPHFSDVDCYNFRFPGAISIWGVDYLDDMQINRINSKVGRKDTIVFLGDIGNLECIKKIRGYKVLIMGNHDSGATNYTDYFDEVYEGTLIIGPKLILSHEPVDFPFALNIHGHEHNLMKYRDDLNVCAEHIDFWPIKIDDIIKSGALKNIPDIHRITINRATARLNKK